VFRKSDELFVENSWVQVMMGQGIMPQSWHPVASRLSARELENFLGQLRQQVARTVATLPSHDAYIARYCAAGSDARAA